jgi:hypothetical protein
MPIDTQWFLEVFLGGFMTVWAFRYFSGSKEKYAEFEWLALSAVWGIVLIGMVGMLPDKDQLAKLFSNPLATGLTSSLLGLFFGYAGSRIARMGWFKWTMSYLGKGGESDKSDKLF